MINNNKRLFGATANVLAIAGGTVESGLNSGITITNPVQINTGAPGVGALTFSGVNPLTLGGVISGFGGVVVNGTASGPLTFTGSTNNVFDGNLVMNSGLLNLSKTAFALGDFGNTIINGGTIQETTNTNEFTSSHSSNVTISATTNAVQTLTFSNSPAPAGGTFNLVFNGATTGAISYSGVATTLETNIQNALNVLTTLGGGNSFVTLPFTNASGNSS